MPNVRTKTNFKRNAQGTARPFIAGLERERLTGLDGFAWQAFTEVAGMNVEKTDGATFTMPNDDDAFQLDEHNSSFGQLQNQTSTLTEYMDERQNTPYIAGVKRDLPFSLWLPQGRGRKLSDPHDFASGTLIDLARLQSDNQDDNFNPSDGDVGNPNKVSVGFQYHGRNRHTIRPAVFVKSHDESDLDYAATGAAFVEARSDKGTITRSWHFIMQGASGEQPVFYTRDTFGNWSSSAFGAAGDTPKKLYPVGGDFIAVGGAGGDSHILIDPDNTSTSMAIADSTGFPTASTDAQDAYVRSVSEIFIVGGQPGVAATKGSIVKVTNPTQAGSVVGSLTAAATTYNAIDGYLDQIVVVGGSGVAAGALGTAAVIMTSIDGGASFTALSTLPSGAKELTAVNMVDEDTFWVGSGDGKLWFTYNFGKTWNSVTPSVALTRISDIRFFWPSGAEEASRVGYVAGEIGSSSKNARVLRTIDGGYSWRADSSYIDQEIKGTAHANTQWNQIAVAGPQSVLLAGASGNTTGMTAFMEYE